MISKSRKKYSLAFIALCVLSMAFVAITGTYPRQVGPYYYAQTPFDSTSINGVGGVVKIYTVATNDTERIGSIVYVSSKNTVSHSATLANYNSLAGIVVGGAATSMKASTSVSDTSTIAATSGQQVLVLERGRFWVLYDTGAGQSPGVGLTESIKSNMGGRAAARATAIDTFYRIIGKTIDTAIAGKAVLTDIRIK